MVMTVMCTVSHKIITWDITHVTVMEGKCALRVGLEEALVCPILMIVPLILVDMEEHVR